MKSRFVPTGPQHINCTYSWNKQVYQAFGRGARGQPPFHPQCGSIDDTIHLIKGFEK